MRRRLMLLKYDLKKKLYWDPIHLYHRTRMEVWDLVAAYYKEKMFLNHYLPPLANGLVSVVQYEMKLANMTVNLVLPWVKNYPSTRKQWLSETLHEEDYSTREK